MTTCQTILLDYDDEMKNTRKLLERVPLDDAALRDYKPHEKSMPLKYLATHVAEIPAWPKLALETEVFVLPSDFQPRVAGSTAELLELFDRNVAEGRACVAAATDDAMRKDWTFKYKDFSMTEPRTKVLRGFLNHMVHHRAQMGVYLRMNNIPIPGMYGPSADES
jgi:uncharacterized damage-inducible protein DinB